MAREMVRGGGRSARIQKAVHGVTRALLEKLDRSEITVPMIAEQAGVTPSTIYRRWGDIGQLFGDVAVERLRPIADPDDTGKAAASRWFWNKAGSDGRPADLGYWIGQRILYTYYQRQSDKRAAIDTILAMRDPDAILRQSGYGNEKGSVAN